MRADGTAAAHLWAVFEPHLDDQSNLLPLIGYVNAINFAATSITREWLTSSPSDGKALDEDLRRVRVNHLSASQSSRALVQSAADDPTVHDRLMAHVLETADNCQTGWSPEECVLALHCPDPLPFLTLSLPTRTGLQVHEFQPAAVEHVAEADAECGKSR